MSFPGGESLAAMKARARHFNRLLAEAVEERIAVVSHRSVLKALLAEALGLGGKWFWKFHLDNASVTVLLHDATRGFVLAKLNETSHLTDFIVLNGISGALRVELGVRHTVYGIRYFEPTLEILAADCYTAGKEIGRR